MEDLRYVAWPTWVRIAKRGLPLTFHSSFLEQPNGISVDQQTSEVSSRAYACPDCVWVTGGGKVTVRYGTLWPEAAVDLSAVDLTP